MSFHFKAFLALVLCGGIFFGGYQLYDRHKKEVAAQQALIQSNNLKAWAGSVMKHAFDLSHGLQGCGFVRFDSTDLAGIGPKPFKMVFEFEPSIEECIKQKDRIQSLASALEPLISDGMTDLSIIDHNSKSPIISFSTATGWKNHTSSPIEFPSNRKEDQ